MISVDLKDCFFHFRVNSKVRDYLAFSFEGHVYHWAVLPFGLCLSPFYCAKIIRPVVSFLREHHNQRCQVFVDDWILFALPGLICDQRDNMLQVLNEVCRKLRSNHDQ